MEESLPFPLRILWIMCVLHFLCWVQHKMYLLIDQNWLREMLLKKLFYIWWDFVTSLVKTIKSTFFNNKQKISTASVKKKKKETIALWYSLIIILYLFSCTLRYLPLLDQFWFVKCFITFRWHVLQLPVNKRIGGGGIHKGFSKTLGRCWPLALQIWEKFWKICQNITQLPNGPPPRTENFERFGENVAKLSNATL